MKSRMIAVAALAGAVATLAEAGPPAAEPQLPPFESVSKGLTKVVSTIDGKPGLYNLYENRKDGRLLAELPGGYANQLVLIATTVASGNEDAGVMGGSIYAKWKKFDKRLALVEPNFMARTHGDAQSKDSVKQLFTERVILDVPIVAKGPKGGPVIDLKGLCIGKHVEFFGPRSGGYGPMVMGARTHLATLDKAKAFPENVEITYKVPGADGRIVALHYSIRVLKKNPAFKPRKADNRVGFFDVYYRELGNPGSDEPHTRYITRWHLEKADPKLKLSPPKQPIVWYIEHTTPVRYRRYVREGILAWNDAFKEIGIINAVEVYQQDSATGAHMEKDPEDARYNFFRWNESTQGYAIGPSRWDPRTGEIIDADVVWHAGLTDAVMSMLKSLSGEIAVSGMTPETLAWLDQHPEWDPRVRLAPPAIRAELLADRKASPPATAECNTIHALGDSQAVHALRPGHQALGESGHACRIGEYLSMNIALFSACLDAGMFDVDEETPMLDNVPEEFIGGMIRYISAHEIGHTMGLQHNFGASTIRTLKEINSEDAKGEPFVASVMEYAAPNINNGDGDVQGDYATSGVGPYDKWAIAFGYGPADKRGEVLARVSEPDHVFLNDVATIGPDPRAQTWDMGADNLNFAESRMRLVRDLRTRIVDDLVKDGDSWKKARDRYDSLLNNHVLSLVIASRWVGGSYTNWDYKGDPGARNPIENVEAERQRRALTFIIENAFEDEAFGLTPELLHKLGHQYWPDGADVSSFMTDPSYEVHDTVAGIQATALTIIMNPTKLRRLYDNEVRTNGSVENPITLAEVLDSVTTHIWSELDDASAGNYTAAKPLISSLRRNLQREQLDRLIALSMPRSGSSPAMRTIATLSTMKLKQISMKIQDAMQRAGSGMDPYTVAHLLDAQTRINKALDAIYIYNR